MPTLVERVEERRSAASLSHPYAVRNAVWLVEGSVLDYFTFLLLSFLNRRTEYSVPPVDVDERSR